MFSILLSCQSSGRFHNTVLIFLWQVKLKQGLKCAMAISSDGNAYLQVNLLQCLFLLRIFPCDCNNTEFSLLC